MNGQPAAAGAVAVQLFHSLWMSRRQARREWAACVLAQAFRNHACPQGRIYCAIDVHHVMLMRSPDLRSPSPHAKAGHNSHPLTLIRTLNIQGTSNKRENRHRLEGPQRSNCCLARQESLPFRRLARRRACAVSHQSRRRRAACTAPSLECASCTWNQALQSPLTQAQVPCKPPLWQGVQWARDCVRCASSRACTAFQQLAPLPGREQCIASAPPRPRGGVHLWTAPLRTGGDTTCHVPHMTRCEYATQLQQARHMCRALQQHSQASSAPDAAAAWQAGLHARPPVADSLDTGLTACLRAAWCGGRPDTSACLRMSKSDCQTAGSPFRGARWFCFL